MSFAELKAHLVFRTVMLFVALLCAVIILIMLGRRNDAVTEALARQAGVLTADEVTVSARHVSGTLEEKFVLESDEVKAGQVLMRLNDRDYRIALKVAQSQEAQARAELEAYRTSMEIAAQNLTLTTESTRRSLESAAAALKSAEETLARATADFKRYEQLLKDHAVSKADYDRVHNDYESALATRIAALKQLQTLSEGLSDEEVEQLRSTGSAADMTPLSLKTAALEVANMKNTFASMQETLTALTATREQAELNLKRTVITAPCAGTVRSIYFEEGELVGADVPALVIEKPERYFDVYLPELYATSYHAGDTVKVQAVTTGQQYTGKVRYLNTAPSYADLRMAREQGQADLTVFEMRIYLDNAELIPGLSMEIAHE